MARTTHDRDLDHRGFDKTTNILLDGATANYADLDVLQDVISDIDDRIDAGGSGSGGLTDLVTGNDQTFAASLGSWVNSGGTLTRDPSYKMHGATASAKFVTTASGQYFELPISGTFKANTDYWFVFFVSNESTSSTYQLELIAGLIGTDSVTKTLNLNMTTDARYVGTQDFVAWGVFWRPTADRTGVKARLSVPITNTTTWHLGMLRVWETPVISTVEAFDRVYTPANTSSNWLGISPWMADSSGLAMTPSGDSWLYNGQSTAGIEFDKATDAYGLMFVEHAAADKPQEGMNIEVGTDYLGFFIGQKNADTVQFYADFDDYNFEFEDGATGKWKAVDSAGHAVSLSGLMNSSVQFVIGGGSSAVTTGIKGDIEMPFAGTITAARLFADQTGSIVVDLWKDTYANYPPTVADTITAAAKPTLSSATKSENTTLTGWTTSFAAGDLLRVNVDSASTVTRVTLALRVRRT